MCVCVCVIFTLVYTDFLCGCVYTVCVYILYVCVLYVYCVCTVCVYNVHTVCGSLNVYVRVKVYTIPASPIVQLYIPCLLAHTTVSLINVFKVMGTFDKPSCVGVRFTYYI